MPFLGELLRQRFNRDRLAPEPRVGAIGMVAAHGCERRRFGAEMAVLVGSEAVGLSSAIFAAAILVAGCELDAATGPIESVQLSNITGLDVAAGLAVVFAEVAAASIGGRSSLDSVGRGGGEGHEVIHFLRGREVAERNFGDLALKLMCEGAWVCGMVGCLLFVGWMTLSSLLPVVPGSAVSVLGSHLGSPEASSSSHVPPLAVRET